MKDYYKDFLKKNKSIMVDIYNKMIENKLFVDTNKNQHGNRFYDYNFNDNEKIHINSREIEIIIHITLKDVTAKLHWALTYLTKKDEKEKFQLSWFNRPEYITICKTEDLESNVRGKMTFHRNGKFGLNIETIGKYKNTYNQLDRYQNELRMYIDDKITTCHSSDNFKNREPHLEDRYKFARELPNSKVIENNLDILGKYLCEAEDFPDSFKDLLLLDSDVNRKDIEDLKVLMPNINLFSKRVKELYTTPKVLATLKKS